MAEQYLYSLLESITTGIKTHLPELKTCEIHEGKMTLPRLQGIATKSPAIHVALLNLPTELTANKAADIELTLVAYITTKDRPNLPSAKSSLHLAEHLLRWLPNQRWCAANAFPAKKVKGQNLWTLDMDNKGISLWAITWQQVIRLPPLLDKDAPLAKSLYIDDGRDVIAVGETGE